MLAASRLLFASFVCLSVGLTPLACGRGGPLIYQVPSDGSDGGGGSLDGGDGDGSLDGGDASDDVGDAGANPVLFSVTTNASGDGPVDMIELSEARNEAISAGVSAAFLRRSPKELSDVSSYDELKAEADFFASHGLVLGYGLAIVDGTATGLPAPLAGLSWASPELGSAMRAHVDKVLASLPGGATYFVLGRDVDSYLAKHPSERAAFEVFAKELMSYVRNHPLSPKDVALGVGFSFAGAAAKDSSFVSLFSASDVVSLSYLPGHGALELPPTSVVATDMDAMVVLAQDKPIVLESFGYSSSALLGGSDEQQGLFLDTAYKAIASRRSAFALVNVDMLHDLGVERCAELALRKGVAVDGPVAAYWCSLGARTAGDLEKPAWASLVSGAAAFASP